MTIADLSRRSMMGIAVITAAATFVPASASITAPAPMPPLQTVRTDLLEIAYAEYGPAAGPVVVLLHGWPYDIHSFAEIAPILAAKAIASSSRICAAIRQVTNTATPKRRAS